MKKGSLRKIRRQKIERKQWDAVSLIVHDDKRPIDDEPLKRGRKRRCKRWEKRRITALLKEHGGKLLAGGFSALL